MDPSQMLKVPPDDLIQAPTPLASLDQNTISRTTSKMSVGRAFAHDHDPWKQ
jgi:hypothetical protein